MLCTSAWAPHHAWSTHIHRKIKHITHGHASWHAPASSLATGMHAWAAWRTSPIISETIPNKMERIKCVPCTQDIQWWSYAVLYCIIIAWEAKECFLFARGNAKECCCPFRQYAMTCLRSPAPMLSRHAHASLKIERSNVVSFSWFVNALLVQWYKFSSFCLVPNDWSVRIDESKVSF